MKNDANRLRYVLMGMIFFLSVASGGDLSADQKNTPSKKQMKQTVEKAVAQYEAGHRADAKGLLEEVEADFPENYAIPYYLGLIYLEEGNQAAAISHWQQYVTMVPETENALKIRKYLTLFIREQAGENARNAVAKNNGGMKGAPDLHSIVVVPFENQGYDIFGALGKGMAAMLMADLSKIPELDVVDRIEIDMLLKEMGLDGDGRIDAKKAQKVGPLLNAAHVITGQLNDSGNHYLQVNSTVFSASEKGDVQHQEAVGALTQFYDLEKELADNILKDIGKPVDKIPAAFHKIHTRSLQALIAFSWGLEHSDRKAYDNAREMFQKALEKDPGFKLAEEALLATPTTAMLNQSRSQMIADASSSGPSSDVAGSALVGSRGISKTKMIIGGLAVVAGGAALAGGGGGGGGDSPPGPPRNYNKQLTGMWRGMWTPSGGNDSTEIILKLEQQSETSVSGQIVTSNGACMPTGELTHGKFGKPTMELQGDSSSGHTYQLKGTCTDDACVHIEGNWQVEKASETSCPSSDGSFRITKDGNAKVTW